MAVLPDADRTRVERALNRATKAFGLSFAGMTKPDLRAAINATDLWIDDNAASFNTALPLPFRTSASQVEKTLLFCAVACMRAGLGVLRAVFGEVE